MLLNILFTFFSVLGLKSDARPPFLFSDEIGVFQKYKALLVNVREQKISPPEARANFVELMSLLKQAYPNTLDSSEILNIVFPLTKSNISAVGGGGSGYFVKQFDLFDYNVSGSHPAHDIFIYDLNQDCIDDRKNDFVDIVSVGNGIVLAVETNWSDTSAYKGGNYVWVYDSERGGLWYYAHHRKVVVEPGQRVKPGDKLGEVGRTGFNAKNKRSDTHLHLMYLELDENLLPQPVNYINWLKNAKSINKSTNAEYQRPSLIGDVPFLKALKIKPIPTRNFRLAVKKK